MASSRPARLAGALLALVVGIGSLGSLLALERGLRLETEAAEALGLRAPGLLDAMRRSESPVRARLLLARALLAVGVADGSDAEAPEGAAGPEAGTENRLHRLEEADRLARSVLARHPASWEAAAVAGAATYVRWSEARDPRLLQEYRRWERPLLYALEIAPVRREPARYLAAAYLELWPALSEEKRVLAKQLVESAFTDRETFGRLLDPWLRVAPGPAALEPVPDRPWAWAGLRDRAGRRGDWSAVCEAWRRERRAVARDLRLGLAEAGEMVAGGELGLARKHLLALVAEAPVDGAFAPTVDAALRLLPHGPGRGRGARASARWLAWAMARDLAGGETSLSAESLVRLRVLAFPDEPGEPAAAALTAWVELARGRPDRAREIARRAAAPWRPEWAPYFLLEARFHLDRGRSGPAREALRQVHPDWRRHPAFQRLARRLGEPLPEPAAGDSTTLATALDWTYSGSAAHLAVEAQGSASGAVVTLAEVPAPGAALAIRWDGEVLGCRALAPATDRVEIPLEAGPGIHELVLEPLAGARIYPGTVELRPPTPPRRPG